MKLRLSVELSLVTVGNTQYYSNMPQDMIDKYPSYINALGVLRKVSDSSELKIASNYLAEEYVFIRVEKFGDLTLKDSVNRHFPKFDCEFVKEVE